jgi:hypothetical protein
MSSDLAQDERCLVRREALLRALAIVRRYQDENWRRPRVNDVCSDIMRLLNEEIARHASERRERSQAPAGGGQQRNSKRFNLVRESSD